MKISLESFDKGYQIEFNNDKKIEEFFKETSLGNFSEFMYFSTYKTMDLFSYPEKFQYSLRNQSNLYYDIHPIITVLSVKDSTKSTIKYPIQGLINAEKFINDFSKRVNEFIIEIVKPYYQTKRYIETKESKLINNNIVNKEGYSKHWYSYYRNYKKYILDFNEGLIIK